MGTPSFRLFQIAQAYLNAKTNKLFDQESDAQIAMLA